MSNEVTVGSGSTSFAGLPVPPEEKVARWAGHGAIIAVGVAGVITFMPYINKAIGLVVDGVWGVAQLLWAGAAACATVVFLSAAWPLYKRGIAYLANKATWSMIDYDPVYHIQLWLKEVHQDRLQIESDYGEARGSVESNDQTVADNRREADRADQRFREAVRQRGEDSPEARMMSLEAGTKRETADRIEANTAPLREVVSILKEVCEAAVFNEKKAQLDAAASIQDYKASKIIQHGTEAANRALGSRSQKNADAMMATQIIHEKYAGSIGRLQSFRELARSAMTSIQMDRGVYHQEALERLRAESRLITGSSAKPVVLDAVPAGQVGEVSFYKVPVSAKPSRK